LTKKGENWDIQVEEMGTEATRNHMGKLPKITNQGQKTQAQAQRLGEVGEIQLGFWGGGQGENGGGSRQHIKAEETASFHLYQ